MCFGFEGVLYSVKRWRADWTEGTFSQSESFNEPPTQSGPLTRVRSHQRLLLTPDHVNTTKTLLPSPVPGANSTPLLPPPAKKNPKPNGLIPDPKLERASR